MPFVERDGVKIYYEDSGGDGEVLFLTHGFGSGADMWDPQLELNSKFRLIRWDMRGHARSDSPDDASMYSKQHQVDDMRAVLDACRVDQAVFLGHSMGAYDNMLFFFSCPENARRMRALIVFASGPGFAKAKAREGWNNTSDKMAAEFATKGILANSYDRFKGHSAHGVKIGLAHSAKYVYGHRDDDPLFMRMRDGASVVALHLDELKLPTLILIGDKDKGFKAGCEVLKAKCPNARMEFVTNAGHMANEHQPQIFNKHITEFVESLVLTSKL